MERGYMPILKNKLTQQQLPPVKNAEGQLGNLPALDKAVEHHYFQIGKSSIREPLSIAIKLLFFFTGNGGSHMFLKTIYRGFLQEH